MNKYLEKILGVYGETKEKVEKDFWKKEVPLSLAFCVASIVYPYFGFLSMYFSIRGIAHVEKLRRLKYKSYEEEAKKWEGKIRTLLSKVE
ncbi:MAG: hypothetical protein QXQ69_00840 [Candidatus Aenigmatarchaeota archaeon]